MISGFSIDFWEIRLDNFFHFTAATFHANRWHLYQLLLLLKFAVLPFSYLVSAFQSFVPRNAVFRRRFHHLRESQHFPSWEAISGNCHERGYGVGFFTSFEIWFLMEFHGTSWSFFLFSGMMLVLPLEIDLCCLCCVTMLGVLFGMLLPRK